MIVNAGGNQSHVVFAAEPEEGVPGSGTRRDGLRQQVGDIAGRPPRPHDAEVDQNQTAGSKQHVVGPAVAVAEREWLVQVNHQFDDVVPKPVGVTHESLGEHRGVPEHHIVAPGPVYAVHGVRHLGNHRPLNDRLVGQHRSAPIVSVHTGKGGQNGR